MKTSPLRQRFIEGLTLKGYSPRSIETYVSVVAQLAKHYHVVKQLLGHKSLSTMVGYLHISRPTMAQIQSPLDGMNWAPPPERRLVSHRPGRVTRVACVRAGQGPPALRLAVVLRAAIAAAGSILCRARAATGTVRIVKASKPSPG